MSVVRKAVIPAAGWGTRMLPAAKAVPKEMLPVVDRPALQHVVEEAASAGIEDVLLITSRGKRALEDHFERNPELEGRLAAGGRQALLESIEQLMAKVKVHAVRQEAQLGLGHAVLQAEAHVGDEPFLCLLGDTIFSGGPSPARQLLEAHQRFGTSIIGLEQVPLEKVSRYGVVGGEVVAEGVLRLEALIEKPSPQEAPSRMAIAARYLLTPAVFACLRRVSPGKGGEIQLTDALRLLLAEQPIHGVVLAARRHDIGNPVDWLRTNLVFARRDPAVWAQLEVLVRSLLE
jgi:UTP--glucose-1-phosphate uridylyltransferase